jgi:replicative DNA helicase
VVTSQEEAAEQAAALERVVLGALMTQPEMVDEVVTILTTSDFYKPVHGAIYAAITANAALGEPTDPMAVAVTLSQYGELGAVGGAAYLHTCMSSVPVASQAPWYARRIAERSYARRARDAALRLQQAAESGNREQVEAAYEHLQRDMASSTADSSTWRANLLNGAAFIYDSPAKVTSVWGSGDDILWASGESLIICGPQGVGKTTLAGQIVAARLGLIPSVLDWQVTPGSRRVLYLAMDRPQQAARSMQRRMQPEWRSVIHDRMTVWQGPPPADFAISSTVLVEMCRAADADTVVVDSVKDAAVGISKDEVGAGYNRARQAAIAAGVEVVELHHQRKSGEGGGKPKSLADVYGSVWVPGGAGSVVLLWGDAGDPVVELLHLKQPRNDVGPLDVIHDHHAGTSRVDRGDKTRDLVWLASTSGRVGLTAKAAAVALYETTSPTRKDVEKARRKLDGYVRSGVMVKRDGVRGGNDPDPTSYFLVERREGDR